MKPFFFWMATNTEVKPNSLRYIFCTLTLFAAAETTFSDWGAVELAWLFSPAAAAQLRLESESTGLFRFKDLVFLN